MPYTAGDFSFGWWNSSLGQKGNNERIFAEDLWQFNKSNRWLYIDNSEVLKWALQKEELSFLILKMEETENKKN